MKQKALVIGIDDYHGSPLHCCLNDAEEIARLLKTDSQSALADMINHFHTEQANRLAVFRDSLQLL